MPNRRHFLLGTLATAIIPPTTAAGGGPVSRIGPVGDLTDKLASLRSDETLEVTGGTWTVSRDVKARGRLIFRGGKLRPATGVTIILDQEPDARPEFDLFDVSQLTWVRGRQKSAKLKQSSSIWSLDGGVRIPGTVYATWFGAVSVSGVDNSKCLQAMLDTGASEAVLNGFFDHHANWVGDGMTLRGLAPLGGDGRFGLRTLPVEVRYGDLLANGPASAPEEEAFRGLSTRSGIGSVAFRDFEYDGSADKSLDHRDGYRSYFPSPAEVAAGKKSFRRFRLRQCGISISTDEAAAGGYVPPAQTLIERMYIHNTVRSSIVANRAPRVTVRDCHLANSDADHLIYADQNPDLLVEGTTFSGYANDGMLVISCGKVIDCRFVDIRPNPMAALATNFLISLRNDLDEPVTIAGLSVSGDLGAVSQEPEGGALFRVAGRRNAQISDVSIDHTGSDNVRFSVFSANFATSGISVRNLSASSMPGAAQLWNTNKKVSDLTLSNISWATSTDAAVPELMSFGALDRADFNGISLKGTRYSALAAVARNARGVTTDRISATAGSLQMVRSGRRGN